MGLVGSPPRPESACSWLFSLSPLNVFGSSPSHIPKLLCNPAGVSCLRWVSTWAQSHLLSPRDAPESTVHIVPVLGSYRFALPALGAQTAVDDPSFHFWVLQLGWIRGQGPQDHPHSAVHPQDHWTWPVMVLTAQIGYSGTVRIHSPATGGQIQEEPRALPFVWQVLLAREAC